jgi:hypothetical protein
MVTSRAQFDADRYEQFQNYSTVKSAEMPHEIKCETCNRSLFISSDDHDRYVRKAKQGIEDPYFCDDCKAADNEEFRP